MPEATGPPALLKNQAQSSRRLEREAHELTWLTPRQPKYHLPPSALPLGSTAFCADPGSDQVRLKPSSSAAAQSIACATVSPCVVHLAIIFGTVACA